jgi:hypothetical protein
MKKQRLKSLKNKIRSAWDKLGVFFGFKMWVREVPSRPKFQTCPVHHITMKRIGKTEMGAFYRCPKCPNPRHIEGGGKKLIPL